MTNLTDTAAYPFGGGPIGFEVGQRTSVFSADWPERATASLYPKDVRNVTRLRQQAALARGTYGFTSLPVWMNGSARSLPLDSQNDLPFPDRSLWRTVRDLLYTDPTLALIYGARFSSDFTGSFNTGPGVRTRQAYQMSFDGSALPTELTLSDARTIRLADSLWDFMTAADPVFLAADDGNLVFRGLSSIEFQALPFSGTTLPVSSFVNGTFDLNAVCVWKEARSLSDNEYLPPAMSVSIIAPGFDLAGGVLPAPTTGPVWEPESGGASIPVPLPSSGVLSTDVTVWPEQTYPFALVPSSDTSVGLNYIGIADKATEQAIFSNGVQIGIAFPVDLRNGWDAAGELIRVVRKDEENDFSYSGRQQRLWSAALLSYGNQTGSGSCGTLERTLSAFTGRTAFIGAWDGHTSSYLPSSVTHLDAIEPLGDEDQAYLRLSLGEIRPGTTLNEYICSEDLGDFYSVEVRVNNTVLIPGKDWLRSKLRPDTLFLKTALDVNDELGVVATGRSRIRVTVTGETTVCLPQMGGSETHKANAKIFAEDNSVLRGQGYRSSGSSATLLSALVPPPTRPSGASVPAATIAVSCGAKFSTAAVIEKRRLREPGQSFMTSLGLALAAKPAVKTWEESTVSSSSYGPPLDLDMEVSFV